MYLLQRLFGEGGDPIGEAKDNWMKARRAILRSPLDRIGYGGYLKLAFRTRQLELSARGEVFYNNSYNNVKDMRTETFDYQLGGDLQYYLPWGFECSSDLTYFLRTGYGYDSSGRKNLIWNCQLSKAFLKKKQLLLRFKFYDILRQEISMVRTISATAIRDADYNVLGRYFMVHAILRLNMMGKK